MLIGQLMICVLWKGLDLSSSFEGMTLTRLEWGLGGVFVLACTDVNYEEKEISRISLQKLLLSETVQKLNFTAPFW